MRYNRCLVAREKRSMRLERGIVFLAALGVALKEEKVLREAVSFVNAAASLSVQRLGASSSLPNRESVEAALQT